MIARLEGILPPWFGAPAPALMEGFFITSLASARHVAFFLIDGARSNGTLNLVFLFMFVVSRAVFRRSWVAVALTSLVLVTVFTLNFSLLGAPMSLVLAGSGLTVAVILYILLRWGLLAALAMGVVYVWLFAAPLTLDTSAWYAGRSYFVLAAYVASLRGTTPAGAKAGEGEVIPGWFGGQSAPGTATPP